MSYSTEYGFEMTENPFAKEHTVAMQGMQLHDVMTIQLVNESLTILRVPNGYLYKKANQIPVFVPEFKNSPLPKMPINEKV